MSCLVPIFITFSLAHLAGAQVPAPPANATDGNGGSSTGPGLVVGVTFAALGGCILVAFLLIAGFTSDCCRKNRSAPPARSHGRFVKPRRFSCGSWNNPALEAQQHVSTLGYGDECTSHAVETSNTEYPPSNAPLPPPPYRNNSNEGVTHAASELPPPSVDENVDAVC